MIVKVKSKCETCVHEKVCIKKDGMQTIEHEFDNFLGSESYAGVQKYMDQLGLGVDIICEDYLAKVKVMPV
jgi:hypothetical protein|nr:MAG TPA: hypothetical protein [Caudoviricetes sp.]